MTRAILHVDMDAFFASVEVRERPELAGQAVIVGGTPQGRGVVAAASYEARRYGIHSAMPTATALRLCPEAVLLPPRHDLYAEVSAEIREIFLRYTPLVEPLSVDEAFLDVTGSLALFGPAAEIGRRIKREIREELNLVASVGVAPNKYLAKLASDMDKPDGFLEVTAESAQTLLDPLPVTRLWGVGAASARQLERLGIHMIGQLRSYPPRVLASHLGNLALHLRQLAQGLDDRPVIPEQEAKSISHETTFPRDVDDPEALRHWLADLAEQVGWRLRRHGLQGKTVSVKVRFADFTTITRSLTLPRPTDLTRTIRDTGLRLYAERVPRGHPPVRLIGIGISGFEAPEQGQGDLFGESGARERQVDSVIDAIRARFGPAAAKRGRGSP